jgi:hypothetical protein
MTGERDAAISVGNPNRHTRGIPVEDPSGTVADAKQLAAQGTPELGRLTLAVGPHATRPLRCPVTVR